MTTTTTLSHDAAALLLEGYIRQYVIRWSDAHDQWQGFNEDREPAQWVDLGDTMAEVIEAIQETPNRENWGLTS